MKIDPTYDGQPFKISAGFTVVGWTRSPFDRQYLKNWGRTNDHAALAYASVKNKKTGDASA